MEFECELAVARACAAACEEMVFFADADNVLATVARLTAGCGARVWRLALLCCVGVRAREMLQCAWLLSPEPEGVANTSGWSEACQRVLEELGPCDEAERGFPALVRLLPDKQAALSLCERKCNLVEPAVLAQHAVLVAAVRGDTKAALALLERLPERSQTYFFPQGLVFEAGGNLEAALDAWGKCAPSAAVRMAECGAWRRKGVGQKALACAEEAWQLRHELGEEMALRLQCQIAVMRAETCGETSEALWLLRSATMANASDDCAWFDLAAVQCETGEWEAAETSNEQCLELRRAMCIDGEEDDCTELLSALAQRGVILAGLGLHEQATALLQRLLQAHERHCDWSGVAAALFSLGQLAQAGGHLEAAEALFARCSAVEESRLADAVTVGRIETCHRLAAVRLALGRAEEARALREACVEVARRLVGEQHRACAELAALI